MSEVEHQTKEFCASLKSKYETLEDPKFQRPPLLSEIASEPLHDESRLHHIPLLIMTVNDNETRAVLQQLAPLVGEEKVLTICNQNSDGIKYYIGRFEGVHAVVVASKMSSSGAYGSQSICGIAIEKFKPRAVLAVGVAFGTPAVIRKQNNKLYLGDVLVSNEILPYENVRINDDESKTVRFTSFPIDKVLQNMIDEALKVMPEEDRTNFLDYGTDQYENPRHDAFAVHRCSLLSGPELVDCEKEHRALCEAWAGGSHNILGGEMEGTGIASACCEAKCSKFVIIKAICDWGMGKSAKVQLQAAQHAVIVAQTIVGHFDLKIHNDGFDIKPLAVEKGHPLFKPARQLLVLQQSASPAVAKQQKKLDILEQELKEQEAKPDVQDYFELRRDFFEEKKELATLRAREMHPVNQALRHLWEDGRTEILLSHPNRYSRLTSDVCCIRRVEKTTMKYTKAHIQSKLSEAELESLKRKCGQRHVLFTVDGSDTLSDNKQKSRRLILKKQTPKRRGRQDEDEDGEDEDGQDEDDQDEDDTSGDLEHDRSDL